MGERRRSLREHRRSVQALAGLGPMVEENVSGLGVVGVGCHELDITIVATDRPPDPGNAQRSRVTISLRSCGQASRQRGLGLRRCSAAALRATMAR